MSSRAAKWAAINGGALAPLSLSGPDLAIGVLATFAITGATAGSVITASGLPSGWTLNSAARSLSGTPVVGLKANVILTETLAGKANSPKQNAIMLELKQVRVDYDPTGYMGVVNTRFIPPEALNAGLLSIMATRADYACDDIVMPRLKLPNFFLSTSGEVQATQPRNYNASIEYPIGTVTPVKWNGSAAGVAAPGNPWLTSDPIPVTIPRGAFFKLHIRQASAEGILIAGNQQAFGAIGDQQTFGANVADQTMNPAWVGTAGGNAISGILIAKTNRPTFMIVSDSRDQGIGNGNNTVPYPGQTQPALSPRYGVINLSRGSQKASDVATPINFASRSLLFPNVTHVILNLGTNDLNGSTVTPAQLTALRSAIRAYAPDKIWWQGTIMPKTTSSDAWATLTGQTVDSNNANRVAFNDLVRAGQNDFAGYIELADPVESSRNSGKLKAPPMTDAAITGDGNHLNNAGYAMMKPSVEQALGRIAAVRS
ncbi:SGNH/GDSL hydrolase family protein [Sphingobium sp.]|uniref:SGNH/GDSL hydrolase family protein n=1 Tax=Sphingobium sp. TaxID=1912891 RepID=UPI003BB79AAB